MFLLRKLFCIFWIEWGGCFYILNKSESFTIPICNILKFFPSDCFQRTTLKEVADATGNTLEHAPERKDASDCKKEVLWEDLNESDKDNWDEEDKFTKEKEETLGRESDSSSSSNM